ncbi:MAG: type IV secretory system conjugative DNA transfer family protein [Rhizobiaceae bacterium]
MGLILGYEGEDGQGRAMGFTSPRRLSSSGGLVQDGSAEGHLLCVAPTGAGKSASFAIPQLLSYPGAVIAVDVKGELYRVTERYRRSLGPVAVIDPFRLVSDGADALNPIAHLTANNLCLVDDAYAIAGLFATGRSTNRAGDLDPFWSDWSMDVIAALIVHVLSREDEAHRTLGRVYERFHGDDHVYELAVLLDAESPHAFTRAKLGKYLGLPEITRGGVTATVVQHLRMLASDGVRASLARDTLDPALLTSGAPCTLYLVVPPDKLASHGALLRLMLTALLQRLMRRTHLPEHPTLLLVDEASQLGQIPALVAAITLGRGYGIRAALLVQSLAQLRLAYGDAATAILENASLLTMGRHFSYAMSRELAKQGFGDVSADTLFGLGADQLMVRIGGHKSRVLRKLDYRHDPLLRGRFDANPLYQRAPQEPVR